MSYQKTMTEKKNDLITRAESIMDKAKVENRELTDDEAHPLKRARVSTPRVMASAERRVGREPL